ncbi:MAG TPA: bifunctional phosphoglucose/phosphomannose isomerase [Cryomorphaceae bacterium]|nr:bifunctional phosphoglucose/phosphomannose isomerase [Cryomorphaceae bacterium]
MDQKKAIAEMEAYIEKFPGNLLEAVEIGKNAITNFNTPPVNKVAVVGLGGSGIGGKVISDMVWDCCDAPISFIQDYDIPAWVDSKTLFIAVSYSGNTEETLSALEGAIAQGASITCITSGGKLSEIATDKNFNCIVIPGGQPPRTSFGFNAAQNLFVLGAFGLIAGLDYSGQLVAAGELLQNNQKKIREEARKIAEKLTGLFPVIYSSNRMEGAAVRLRQQINENAKQLCWHHVLPEMNHNELVGWAGAPDNIAALFIHSPEDHAKTKRRQSLTVEIIEKHAKTIVDLHPEGESRIERIYWLIHLGDWISFYMAEANGADPIEIGVIDYFKAELAKL